MLHILNPKQFDGMKNKKKELKPNYLTGKIKHDCTDEQIAEIYSHVDKIDGESWRYFADFSNYYISDKGRIYSTYEHSLLIPYAKNKKRKAKDDDYDYVEISSGKIWIGRKDETITYKVCIPVHKLVGFAFTDIEYYNPYQGKQIHHVNINKKDNSLNNLLSLSSAEHLRIHGMYKYFAQRIIELFSKKIVDDDDIKQNASGE